MADRRPSGEVPGFLRGEVVIHLGENVAGYIVASPTRGIFREGHGLVSLQVAKALLDRALREAPQVDYQVMACVPVREG